jgi:DNA-binding MarR family transcriptional regulator
MAKRKEMSGFDRFAERFRALRQIELSGSHIETMIIAWRFSGQLNAKGIADKVKLSPSTLSSILRDLEYEHGYVAAVEDEKDRRNKLYWLTPAGKQFVLKVAGLVLETDIDDDDVPIMQPVQRPRPQK